MFIMETKDFRHTRYFDLPIAEDDMAKALTEAGVNLKDKPLRLRVRIKDAVPYRNAAKGDLVDTDATEFRLNIYVPPLPTPEGENVKVLLTKYGMEIRHVLKHFAQIRNTGPGTNVNPEEEEALEQEATDFEVTGEVEVLHEFVPVEGAPVKGADAMDKPPGSGSTDPLMEALLAMFSAPDSPMEPLDVMSGSFVTEGNSMKCTDCGKKFPANNAGALVEHMGTCKGKPGE